MSARPYFSASFLLVLAMSCRQTIEETGDTAPVPVDGDGDGVFSDEDCDDNNAAVNPGAAEGCDGVDNDCDDAVDEADAVGAPTWYADIDGDGHGDDASSQAACLQPPGHTQTAGDCDDSRLDVYPGAAETDCADPTDYNCDGSVGYADGDGDGFPACEECDDANAEVNPGATEVPYDGLDNDCAPLTPDDDLDGDGYLKIVDCDDENPEINPGATEVPYDGVDNDCDEGTRDDDVDGDGFLAAADCDDFDEGVNSGAVEVPYNGKDDDCNEATLDDDLDQDGFVKAEDCDDNDAGRYPQGIETAYNNVDDDCNPSTRDDDLDGDGFLKVTDCDDDNADINPGVAEVPYDGIDNDCKPETPDDDVDGDGFLKPEDCNDNNPLVNPGRTEAQYNGLDDDCNEATPDDDLDGDGFVKAEDCNDLDGAINAGVAEVPYNGKDDDCDPSTKDNDLDGDGFAKAVDCDDQDAGVNPAATETPYNGKDDDCRVATKDDDLDGDGFVLAEDCDDNDALESPSLTEVAYNGKDDDCDSTTPDDDVDGDGYLLAEDCDDEDPDINPGEAEIWYDGVDSDCDGANDFDQDGDGLAARVPGGGPDCDDTDSSIGRCGLDPGSAGESCLTLKQADNTLTSGLYYLNPPGNTGAPFQAYCDMTTEGGGYSFFKVAASGATLAPAAEAACAARGMQLFIPRTRAHLLSAWAVANNAGVGPGANADYLRILGIYPRSNGSTCANQPFTSANPTCAWRASDDEAFWVGSRTDIAEPNSDNNAAQSMYYSFNSDGSVAAYNDVTAGYSSNFFMCDVGDKRPTLPRSCAAIKTATPTATDGEYDIDPTLSGAPLRVYCDMTTDGGGWTLVGKGRQGWSWADGGEGTAAGVLNKDDHAVHYLPAETVLSILGKPLNTATDGLRIVRHEPGHEIRWRYTTAPRFTWRFDSSPQTINHTINGVAFNAVTTHDTIGATGNNELRVFTWAWSGHNNVRGFAMGCCGDNVNSGWEIGNTHAISHTWVMVRR